MSFASEMKNELTRIEVDTCCMKSELSALIKMNGALSHFNGEWIINIQTENAAIARRIFSLIRNLYGVEIELLVRRKMKLKKNNVYISRIKKDSRKVLEDLDIMKGGVLSHEISDSVKEKECCIRSYLRGAFLAGGSVNNPETSAYHLEIFSLYEEHAQSLTELMNGYQLNAKFIERKRGYITYLKEAEKIAEFLSLIGGYQALLKFEDIRIVRDMRNSVNRLVNCETANLNKTISAAMRQVENIQFIDEEIGLDELPERLREIARLRVEHQDVSLKELGEMMSTGVISKSGVNHRLRKLDKIADKLRSGEEVTFK
ncbi:MULTISPECIES: DNA-binding protein WhiA [Salinicoccus]|jgi:DNA-binding protein WhiA|uniref:Probable cell division protein WhiA n=3 Tax=Salinicoccus roseus TaxID=45670 RepID=A0A0C2E8I1_9STAP|nr:MULTISPECIES: DNA-binding protein WhiA [Salinicoccus]KIH71632.1 sporulation regulator WhiA [Salinicoccus roseus]MCC4722584.1 DNA-binding protein WhiA [Salinicoccus sp. RF5]MCG7331649.1 DNA-binding protein WhiA [Salinicoccus roseus]MDB0579726.1 DNA-binding protein WhiA [Salinicoccus roseus]OZT77155.1 DNA-binding protein WhiA [Salinicoccus roseus]